MELQLRPYVGRRANAADVDDLLQEIYVRMLKGLPALREEERFGPWVYRIAQNVLVDHHRRLRPVLPAPDDTPAELPEEDPALGLAQSLVPFVGLLPQPYREVIQLTELEGMSQKVVAEMLGLSVSGVKSRVQRGRAELRRMLEACCEIAVDSRGHVIDYRPKSLEQIPPDCCADKGCG